MTSRKFWICQTLFIPQFNFSIGFSFTEKLHHTITSLANDEYADRPYGCQLWLRFAVCLHICLQTK